MPLYLAPPGQVRAPETALFQFQTIVYIQLHQQLLHNHASSSKTNTQLFCWTRLKLCFTLYYFIIRSFVVVLDCCIYIDQNGTETVGSVEVNSETLVQDQEHELYV